MKNNAQKNRNLQAKRKRRENRKLKNTNHNNNNYMNFGGEQMGNYEEGWSKENYKIMHDLTKRLNNAVIPGFFAGSPFVGNPNFKDDGMHVNGYDDIQDVLKCSEEDGKTVGEYLVSHQYFYATRKNDNKKVFVLPENDGTCYSFAPNKFTFFALQIMDALAAAIYNGNFKIEKIIKNSIFFQNFVKKFEFICFPKYNFEFKDEDGNVYIRNARVCSMNGKYYSF